MSRYAKITEPLQAINPTTQTRNGETTRLRPRTGAFGDQRDMTMTEEQAIWDTTTAVVKVHKTGCRVLRSAGRNGHAVLTRAEDIDDMRDRGYTIVRCKCAKVRR